MKYAQVCALHINVEIKEFVGSTTSCSSYQSSQLWLFTRKFLRKWVKEIESEVRNKEYISLFLSEIMTSKKEVTKEASRRCQRKEGKKALSMNSPYLTFNSTQKTPSFFHSTIFGIFWLRSPVLQSSWRAAFFVGSLKRSYFKSLLIDSEHMLVFFVILGWFSSPLKLKNVPWDRRVIGCS